MRYVSRIYVYSWPILNTDFFNIIKGVFQVYMLATHVYILPTLRTDFFNIITGVIQVDMLAAYMFIFGLYYILTSSTLSKESCK